MSSVTGQTVQQLRQDILQELITANQLARLISNELQQIKDFTNPHAKFDSNIKQNAALISTLASTFNITIDNAPPLVRKTIDLNTDGNQNKSYEEHNMLRNNSDMDDTQ